MTIAVEQIDWFDDFKYLESRYCKTGKNATENDYGRRFFFSGHQTCDDIIEDSKGDFNMFKDNMPEQHFNFIDDLDKSLGGCSESCEVYAD